jgi:haloalkane dehalogenase
MGFESLYPFRPNAFAAPGGRIHYLDEGDKNAPVLMMLHGNPTWSFYYRNLILALRSEYRIIAPDHLGCGLSDKPQTWDYRLAGHVENTARLVEHLGLQDVTLVLHDWGGAIGMGAAVRDPGRYRRFVVFNTAAFTAPRMPKSLALARVPGFGALAIRGFNAFARGALWTCAVHKERLTPEVQAAYLRPYDNWKNRIANLRFVQDIPMDAEHPSWAAIRGIEEKLGVFEKHPMLIVWGAQDFVFDDWFFGEWKRRFPGAIAHRLEDAGHFVVEDAHERIIPWMREFLARRTAA